MARSVLTERQRLLVWERDDGTCVLCGKPGTEVDHVTPRRFFGKHQATQQDSLGNLRLLCIDCHRSKHG